MRQGTVGLELLDISPCVSMNVFVFLVGLTGRPEVFMVGIACGREIGNEF